MSFAFPTKKGPVLYGTITFCHFFAPSFASPSASVIDLTNVPPILLVAGISYPRSAGKRFCSGAIAHADAGSYGEGKSTHKITSIFQQVGIEVHAHVCTPPPVFPTFSVERNTRKEFHRGQNVNSCNFLSAHAHVLKYTYTQGIIKSQGRNACSGTSYLFASHVFYNTVYHLIHLDVCYRCWCCA